MNLRGRSRKPATTKMNVFTTIVNCWGPLVTVVKIFIIDVDFLFSFIQIKYDFF